ncbi:MAG: HNH endonuclease [Anaerolineae bacterium]|nr:HNH endonuclease [Anaerolineae bacterium]
MTTISAAIREQVRQRASRRCEYCRKPESIDIYSPQVDHIIPQRHEGSSELDNLAWACFRCNNKKGSEISGYDKPTGELTPLFNPRTQAWDEHFEMVEAVLIGKTAIGRVTIWLLEMNHPKQIESRRSLIEAGAW